MRKKICQKCFDAWGIGTAISGVANAGVNIAGSIMQNQIAQQNLALQRENLDWQKQVQQTTWDREDTAYQRQRDDMLAAGLNPLLNTSSGANAGAVVPTEAPQNGLDALTSMSNLGAAINQIVDGLQQNREREATISKAEAEAANLNAATEEQEIKNDYTADLLEADRRKRTSDADESERINKIHEKYGTSSESPDLLKTATSIAEMVDSNKLDTLIESFKGSGNKYLEKLAFEFEKAGINPPGRNLSESDVETLGAPRPNEPKILKGAPFFKTKKMKENDLRTKNSNYWKSYANSKINKE